MASAREPPRPQAPAVVEVAGCRLPPIPLTNADDIAWVRQRWKELGKFAIGSSCPNFTGRADEKTNVGVADLVGEEIVELALLVAADQSYQIVIYEPIMPRGDIEANPDD